VIKCCDDEFIYYCVLLLAVDRWPSGTYGIPKPQGGCPSPITHWSSGSRIILRVVSLWYVW